MNIHLYSVQIRVLLYQEGGQWAARSLEMDLLGYGRSPEEAIDELKRAVEAQISFAAQMDDSGLIPFRADDDYFSRWEEAQEKSLNSRILGDKTTTLSARAAMISFTEAELKVLRKRRFKQAGPVCA